MTQFWGAPCLLVAPHWHALPLVFGPWSLVGLSAVGRLRSAVFLCYTFSLEARMSIALIAAVADNGVIGAGGKVPWRSVEDLRWFREATMGNACLMGRKTWEGLQAPLIGRRNLVLTHQEGYRAKGAEVVRDLDELLASFQQSEETLFVCGGAEVYRGALPSVARIYLTEVHSRPAGDVTFLQFPREAFREVFRRESITDPACTFLLLDRFGGR